MQHDPYAFLDEEDDGPAAAGAEPVPSGRHDGFTPQRRRLFLRTLRKTGCVADACRVAGISDTTAYNTRTRDAEFAAAWASALSRAGTDIEVLAWQRGVEGVEEEVWAYGKQVGVRRKTDPRIFRMLLQASSPARYGGQGYGSRKALERKIRKQVEAELEAERAAEYDQEEVEAARERIALRIEKMQQREIARLGLQVDPDSGRIIPPGYIRDPDYVAPPPPADADHEWAEEDEWHDPGPARPDDAASPPRPEPRIVLL